MSVTLASGSRLVGTVCLALALAVLQACGGGGGGGGSSAPAPTAPVIVAPSIDTQPKAATAVDGTTATFSVSASGTTLSYQWQKDGQNITGATAASYTTPALRYADNGAKYQVVVTGPNATVTSSPVALAVSPIAVSITTQPAAQSAKDGEVVSFDVAAKGSEPLQYQWLRNGTPIAGATQATYTTAALALADSGAVYSVKVTNPVGSVASQDAKLLVSAVAPRVITDPESVTTVDGSSVTLKVVAGGSAPLSYQWQRNGTAIDGATGASYTTTLDYAGSGDRYTVLISNGAGNVTSAAAVMTVNAAAPAVSGHPSDSTVLTGSDASFSVTATGTAPLRYQWQQSTNGGLTWSPIAGATSSSYAIRGATLADTNLRYRVAVTNAAATLTSSPAKLTVQARLRLIAGTAGGLGYAEGKGSLARFRAMAGMAVDSAGVIYLADADNEVFRRVLPDGTTSLLAGRPNEYGWDNGPAKDARFMRPVGVILDRSGDILLADTCSIRKLNSAGRVVEFVGSNVCGVRDGTGANAGFGYISGLVQDPDGNLFVTERSPSSVGQLIRKVTPAGVVSLFAGSATESGTDDGPRLLARFSSLGHLTIDADRNLFVIDGSTIRKVTPGGDVSTFAGAPNSYGYFEGFRTAARLSAMQGLAFDSAGNLFLSEGSRLSRITPAGTLAAAINYSIDATGRYVSKDGPWGTASVGQAGALAVLPNGNLALLDSLSGSVRLVSPTFTVTTLAGGAAINGYVDGVGSSARFSPAALNGTDMAFGFGGVLLGDADNYRLRRISPDSGRVDTFAGNGKYGSDDGSALAASFGWPHGMALDRAGNLYVTDLTQHVIRRISASGVVTTIAGKPGQSGSADGVGSAARFNTPYSIVVDSQGNLIVADAGNRVFRRISPDGGVSTLAGKVGEAGFANGKGADVRLMSVYSMVIDKDDNVYFTENMHTVRKLSLSGEVSTVAGAPYSPGSVDDLAPFARFSMPRNLALDARGNVYVCDSGNGTVRRISPDGYVTTVMGQPGASILQLGVGGSLNGPLGIAISPEGRLFVLSEGAIVGD